MKVRVPWGPEVSLRSFAELSPAGGRSTSGGVSLRKKKVRDLSSRVFERARNASGTQGRITVLIHVAFNYCCFCYDFDESNSTL